MKVLAIELSTARGSLAWADGATECLREWDNDRKDSGAFFSNLTTITKQFGLPERIIVGLGPGSYAGVRIALSSAIGLKTAAGCELLGYPSICALAVAEVDYVVVGDARRRSFYFAHIRDRKLEGDIKLYGPAEFKNRLTDSKLPVFCSEHLPEFGVIRVHYPSAAILAKMAASEDPQFFRCSLEPIYLREPHITIPKAKSL